MTAPDSPSTPAEAAPPFRWGLGAAIFLAGIGVTLLGFLWFGRDDPAAYWEAAIVNLGTTILLAAALVWLERALVKSVRASAQRVAEDAADKAATKAADAATNKTVEELLPRLDALDERLRERRTAVADEVAARASKVSELGSFDAVHDALSAADQIGALAPPRTGEDSWSTTGVEIIVPAGSELGAPRIVTTFVPQGAARTPTVQLSFAENGRRHLRATATWTPDQSPEEAFVALQEAMITAGNGAAAREMSVETFFGNLGSIVRDAMLARRAADGAWMSGSPVIELVADGLAITRNGVEVRGQAGGPQVGRDLFGQFDPRVPSRIVGYRAPSVPPEGIEKDVWDSAIGRATGHFVNSQVAW